MDPEIEDALATYTLEHHDTRGEWREIPPSGRDPSVTLVVRVYCWCGSTLHLELPRWPEDDCGICHTVYRLSRGEASAEPYVRCTRVNPEHQTDVVAFLERTGRSSSSASDAD